MTKQPEKFSEKIITEQPDLYLLLAVWFGLLTGLIEIVSLGVAAILLHRYTHLGIDIVWEAPLANIVIFSIVGLLVYLFARSNRHAVSLRLVTLIYSFFLFLGASLTIISLDRYAGMVLSAGLAVQVSSWIGSHPSQFLGIVRATTSWLPIFDRPRLAGTVNESPVGEESPAPLSRRQFLLGTGAMVAGLALSANTWQAFTNRRTGGRISVGKSPNVLLITLDTVRARNLSIYGYTRNTSPNLATLAASGVRFERAISTAPWTLPSHASIFTGRYSHELSVDWSKALDLNYPTLAEVLTAKGYDTAGFIANTIYLTAESGVNRGFAHYEDFPLSAGKIIMSARLTDALAKNDDLRRLIGYYQDPDRKFAPEVSKGFLNWLSTRDQSRPFFAFLNYFDAHSPYLPPKPYDTRFGSGLPRENVRMTVGKHWSQEGIQAEIDAYDGCISYLDDQLGSLFDELRQRRVLDNTLVIITSDHGEEFGEHGVMTHGYSLYIPSLHVPLVMILPSVIPAPAIVETPVTLRDIPATILDLVGKADASPLPGKSLARYWNGAVDSTDGGIEALLSEVNKAESSLPEAYPIAKGDLKSIVLDHQHYIKGSANQEELFDWVSDASEHANLAHSDTAQNLLARLRQSLASLLRRT